MGIDVFKAMARGRPFVPFLVRTSSGESFTVKHPEVYWLDPDGTTLLIKDPDQGVVLIDPAAVTECVRQQPTPKGEPA